MHPADGSRVFPESLVTPDPGVFPASEPLPAPRGDPVRAARLFNLPSDWSAVAARAGDCFCLGCLCCLCYKDRKRRLLASIVCVLAGAAGWWLAAGLVAGCGVGLWCWLVGLARPGRQPAVRGGRKGMSRADLPYPAFACQVGIFSRRLICAYWHFRGPLAYRICAYLGIMEVLVTW